MSSSSKNIFGIVCFIAMASYAAYSHYQLGKLQMINKIGSEARFLNDDNFRDVMFSLLHDIRNNTIESSRNTGRVEGMIAVISNQKPSDSETSALWHAGYYRGIDQQNDMAALAYEEGYHKACDDISCPADKRPNSESIRAKSPFIRTREDDKIQPVGNNENTKPKTSVTIPAQPEIKKEVKSENKSK